MHKIHLKLIQKYQIYHSWHQTKHHNKVHWGVFIVFTFLVFGMILRWTPISLAADTVAPATPTNLAAAAVSSTQINLSWAASTDNVGVTGYKIYRCAGSACSPTAQIANSTTNSYSDTGLTANTTYTYAVSAYDAAGNESGQSSSVSAITQSSLVSTISVPLIVQETSGITRINEPVTSGIPIPQAANLLSAATLGIFDGTTEIPAQFQVLARWRGTPDDPSKPIKWILVDFQATVATNTSKTYTLKDTGSGTASTGITVNDGVSSIIINSGEAEFVINKDNFNLFDKVKIAKDSDGIVDDEIVSPLNQNGAVFTDGNDKKFYTGLSKPSEITVEEQGPMRLVILAKGKHRAPDSSETIDYIVKMYFYNNKSFVKVFYTFTNKESSDITSGIAFNDISLNTKINLHSSATNFAFGGDRTIHTGNLTPGQDAYIYQYGQRDDGAAGTGGPSTINYILGGVASGLGGHALGWADLNDSGWGLTTTIKNFWQLYPKAQYVSNTGDIAVKLWPSYNVKPSDGIADVVWAGGAKTHEILFYFHRRTHVDAKSEDIAKGFVNEPLFAQADPDWYVNSKAFGSITTTNISQFKPEYQNLVQSYYNKLEKDFDYMISQRESDRFMGMHNYGMWHFGDGRQDYWSNFAYDAPYILIKAFAGSGKRKYIKAAVEGIEHWRDVDVIHHYPGNPLMTGMTQYLPNYGTMHGMGREPRTLYGFNLIKNSSLIWDYFLRGDRHSLDMAREIAENVKNAWLRFDRDNIMYDSRNMGKPLWVLLAMYEATGDIGWLNNNVYNRGSIDHNTYKASAYTIAYKVKEWTEITPSDPFWGIYAINMNGGMVSVDYPGAQQHVNPYGMGVTMHGLYTYYELTQDEQIKKTIIETAKWLNDVDGQNGGFKDSIDGLPLWRDSGVGEAFPHWGRNYLASGLIVGWMGKVFKLTGNQLYLDRAVSALTTIVNYTGYGMDWKLFGEKYYTVPDLLYYLTVTLDTTPPTTPTELTATAVSSSQINLSWSASTDDVGVAGYKIYRCAGSGCAPTVQIATSAVSSYSNTGLAASTAYTYAVSAYDAAGNESGKSSLGQATTLSQFKPSDLNQDQKVDQLDFDILKQDWNRTDKPVSDLNQDGVVDSRDLGIMMSSWEN